jgi:hypothetical protein
MASLVVPDGWSLGGTTYVCEEAVTAGFAGVYEPLKSRNGLSMPRGRRWVSAIIRKGELLAVWSLLPRSFDTSSPIHVSSIAKSSVQDYTERASRLTRQDVLTDFSRENVVVSKIILVKRRLITRAAYCFFFGIFGMFVAGIVLYGVAAVRA